MTTQLEIDEGLLDAFVGDGSIAEVLYVVRCGKEANVYCCRGGTEASGRLVAAKIYRPLTRRNFHNDAMYQTGRDAAYETRTRRALKNKSGFGRDVQYGTWIHQVEAGMCRFGKDTEAAGGEADDNLSGSDGESCEHGISGHGTLFGAHGLRTVNRGRPRHSGIIAVGSGRRTPDVGRQASAAGPRLFDVATRAPVCLSQVEQDSGSEV